MNWNLIWVGLVRMYLIMCCLFVLAVLLSLTGSGLLLAIALTLPYSLIPFLAASFLLSGLISLQHRTWASSRLDWPLSACGAAVMLWVLGAHIYNLHSKSQLEKRIALRAEKIVDVMPAAKQWTVRSWTGVMPDCLKFHDSTIDNSCPGRVSLSYCWRMDTAKEWHAKKVDCELNQKERRIFEIGTTTLQAPWCRSYHEACQAELKPLDAKAIHN